MKFSIKSLVVAGAVLLAGLPVMAQRAFDLFNAPKTVQLAAPQNLSVNGGVGNITNGWVDVRMLDGLGSLDVFAYTNTGTTGGTLTMTIQTSPDQSTITTVTNFAAITGTTSITYTNIANTNTTAINPWFVPGTYTNYSVSANLAAGTVLLPPSYTNGCPVTLGPGYYKFSADVDGNNRYWRVIWTAGGTITNWTVGATLSSYNATPLK